MIVADLAVVARETGRLLAEGVHHSRRGTAEGWWFRFQNGWLVSVLCGPEYECRSQSGMFGTDAEVMVLRPDGEPMVWLSGRENVLGWQPVETIAGLIRMVATEGGDHADVSTATSRASRA